MRWDNAFGSQPGRLAQQPDPPTAKAALPQLPHESPHMSAAYDQPRHDGPRQRSEAITHARWKVPPRLAGDASDIRGTDLDNKPIVVRIRGMAPDSLLLFLSSDCLACSGIWHDLRTRLHTIPNPAARTVIVTRGADSENLARLQALAPPGITLVMSTAAWHDYQIPAVPYFIHLAGYSSAVINEGVPTKAADVVGATNQADRLDPI